MWSAVLVCSVIMISYYFFVNSVKLQIGAVIITPTRELAVQIDEVLSHFLRHIDSRFTHMLFIGGNNPAADVDKFLQHGFVTLYNVHLYYLNYFCLLI